MRMWFQSFQSHAPVWNSKKTLLCLLSFLHLCLVEHYEQISCSHCSQVGYFEEKKNLPDESIKVSRNRGIFCEIEVSNLFCVIHFQVQHRFGHRHGPQQSSNQSRPLASAGGDSQPPKRHAQRGQRATHRGREPTGHRWPQPRHQPVHRRSAWGHQARVRPWNYSYSHTIVLIVMCRHKVHHLWLILIFHSAAFIYSVSS